jgi:HK97 family phage major capsid protein
MNDSTAGTLRKLRDGAGGTVGAFLWDPSLTNGVQGGQPDRFLGKPVYTDSNVAAQASNAKTVAFGDMSAYYVRTVGNVVIERDDSRYFDTDQVGFRGKLRVDGDLIDTAAVNIIKQSV